MPKFYRGPYHPIYETEAQKSTHMLPPYSRTRLAVVILMTLLSAPLWALYLQRFWPSDSRSENEPTQPWISYHAFHPPNLNRWTVLDCGMNKSEAVAKGCIFSAREAGWIHPQCVSSDLNRTFWESLHEDEGVLDTFADVDGVETLDTNDVLHGYNGFSEMTPWHAPDVYITWRNHNLHCEYATRTLARALTTRGMGLADRFFEREHQVHCMNVFAAREYHPLDFIMHVGLTYLNCFVPSEYVF